MSHMQPRRISKLGNRVGDLTGQPAFQRGLYQSSRLALVRLRALAGPCSVPCDIVWHTICHQGYKVRVSV